MRSINTSVWPQPSTGLIKKQFGQSERLKPFQNVRINKFVISKQVCSLPLQVVSEYTTLRLRIYDPAFQFSKATSPVVSSHHNAFKEARGDVTTGVTTLSLTGVDCEEAGNDTTWPATQVCPRAVKAGLGGHDAGASGVDEGVETASLPLSKRG